MATNHIASALLEPFEGMHNMIRILFTHPKARAVFDWPVVGPASVHASRLNSGHSAHAKDIEPLVRDMLRESFDFRELWESQTVAGLGRAYKVFHDPRVGSVELNYQTFHVQDAPDNSFSWDPPNQGARVQRPWHSSGRRPPPAGCQRQVTPKRQPRSPRAVSPSSRRSRPLPKLWLFPSEVHPVMRARNVFPRSGILTSHCLPEQSDERSSPKAWKLSDSGSGYPILTWAAGTRIDEDMISCVRRAMRYRMKWDGTRLIVDLTGVHGASRGARESFGLQCGLSRIALFGPSPVERVIAEFTLEAHLCSPSVAFFSSLSEAVGMAFRDRL